MWNKIKAWLLGKVQIAAAVEIQKMDQYEPVLADLIRKELDPDARSKQVVDFVQEKLTEIVNKAFSAKWGSSWILSSVKDKLLAEVSKLDNYEDDIATFLRRKVDPDAKATLIVDYVQDFLTGLVAKYIQKI
jgi:hypothetical protein